VVDSVGQLELFHCRLDELLKVVALFERELTAKAERDDLAMTRWKSGEDLSELETQQFSQFESWRESRAYWWDRGKPEVGAESFRDFNGRHPTPEIRIAFIRCREAIGYSSAGEVPRSALNVFERAVEDYARMMKCRVEMDWPRPLETRFSETFWRANTTSSLENCRKSSILPRLNRNGGEVLLNRLLNLPKCNLGGKQVWMQEMSGSMEMHSTLIKLGLQLNIH